jgi:hypothetical protein
MVYPSNLLRRLRLWAVLLAGVAGCGGSEPVDERLAALDPKALVPAGGVVTVNGKPVATLVITFLPPSGPALGTAETDKDGKYQLSSMGGPGVLPGDYKVAISYMVSDKGEPQGMAARSSLVQRSGMLSAKEQLPAEYADLGRSKLSANVGPQGGQFNFGVEATIPAVEEKPAEKRAEEAKSAETKTTDKKE